jgi:hypothetical protein
MSSDSSLQLVEEKYNDLCNTPSDIYQHLPTLYKYATECDSVVECGVRYCVSSWAFAYGLLNNNKPDKHLFLNDISYSSIDEILEKTKNTYISIEYEWVSNLNLQLKRDYDLIFIDTWHVYGQLKRELAHLSKFAKKYIIMHDTEIDKIHGESVRNHHDIELKMKESGFSKEEIECGLQRAIDEFLLENKEWKLKEVYTNNNGLTILEKL